VPSPAGRGFTAEEVAREVGGRLRGAPSLRLTGVAALESAGPSDLSFLHRPEYRAAAESSRAGCLLVADDGSLPGRAIIAVRDPYRGFALAMRLFHPPAAPREGLAASAHVDPSAAVAASAEVAPGAFVGPGCRVGERTVVGPGAVLLRDVAVGADCRIAPGVALLADTVVGDRVVVHANAVLGADGFGYSSGSDGHLKIPHAGRVVVEDDVEIGAATCIDRAVLGETRIGAGTKIDNLVQVAHNVTIGPGCLIVAQSGVAGSSRLGRGCVLAGQSGVAGHLTVGDGVRVAAKSAVLQDVEPGATVAGIPAGPLASWRRMAAALRRLPDLLSRVRRLEQGLDGGSGRPEENE